MYTTYHICRVIRGIFGKKRPYTTAVILAGGMGSRMQRKDGKTKQMLPLGGRPILLHTVDAFEKCPYIDDVVIVARKEELSLIRCLMQEAGMKKIRCVVQGGATRQMSALAGFEAVDGKKCAFVAIHDAARCLITPGQISDVVAEAYAYGAAAAACHVYDTVKKTNGDGEILETVDRESLWLAQTPQVFSATLYRAAAYTAKTAGFLATDDAMLCERIGQTVRLVDCGTDNFKITTDADLYRAESVLHRRGAHR